MHEYSIVASIVDSMLEAIRKQGAAKIVSVHFRRGSAFSEEALRQSYESLTTGTDPGRSTGRDRHREFGF
jgi:Zn finger protein HypA/HybF involved in hydrogenase expression